MKRFMLALSLIVGLTITIPAVGPDQHVGGGIVEAGQRCPAGMVASLDGAVMIDGELVPIWGCVPSRQRCCMSFASGESSGDRSNARRVPRRA